MAEWIKEKNPAILSEKTKGVNVMTLRDFNSNDMPLWLQRYWERIQYHATRGMIEENVQYQQLHEECESLEDENRFITKIIEGDAITDSFPINAEEVSVLSTFLKMKADCNELEEMKIYLTGCRDMYYMLRILKIIE